MSQAKFLELHVVLTTPSFDIACQNAMNKGISMIDKLNNGGPDVADFMSVDRIEFVGLEMEPETHKMNPQHTYQFKVWYK